jgi:hypothetical protein
MEKRCLRANQRKGSLLASSNEFPVEEFMTRLRSADLGTGLTSTDHTESSCREVRMGRGDFSGGFANTVIRPWVLNSGSHHRFASDRTGEHCKFPEDGVSATSIFRRPLFDVDLALGRAVRMLPNSLLTRGARWGRRQ